MKHVYNSMVKIAAQFALHYSELVCIFWDLSNIDSEIWMILPRIWKQFFFRGIRKHILIILCINVCMSLLLEALNASDVNTFMSKSVGSYLE